MLLTSNSPHRHSGSLLGGSLLGWAAALIALSAALLVPWMAHLAATLPGTVSARHWPVAWAGLDGAEAVALGATAWLAIRRDRRLPSVATAAATLLLADAWFDVCTAPPGGSASFALLGAVAEVSVAATCLALTRLVRRDPRSGGTHALLAWGPASPRLAAAAGSSRALGMADGRILVLGSLEPAGRALDSGDRRLARSGWMVRVARGTNGRPALEVHDTRGITDVSVAAPVAVALLRGAYRSARRAPAQWSLAWGQLPKGADGVEVVFRARRLIESASTVSIAGQFWVAEVPGRYRTVLVSAGLSRATARVRTHADDARDRKRLHVSHLPHISALEAHRVHCLT